MNDTSSPSALEKGVKKFLKPLETFIHQQAFAGILLAAATLTSLFLANSPLHGIMTQISEVEAGIVLYHWEFFLTLKEWVGSGLMALFFLMIGLEVKRETLAGQLRHPQLIILVILAAAGGMIFPALIYWVINTGTPGQTGWAIPMSTDTAFAIGILSLLAKRASHGAAIFLATLAIFDDIGAIAVSAVFYTQELHPAAFIGAGITLALLLAANLGGARQSWIYIVLGIALWGFIHHSGVHATVAGLLMAVAIPARTHLGQTNFIGDVRALLSIFEKGGQTGAGMLESRQQHALTFDIAEKVRAASTPLQRWELFLISPISIIVLPLFAFLNADIVLSGQEIATALRSPVTLGIMAGLVVGKPLGIALFVYTGLRMKLGQLPGDMKFSEVVGVGMLAGIGFTMSLFITAMGFSQQPALADFAKTGILLASALSAVLASLWFILMRKKISSG